MDALRKALAMGADRAVLITDPALEGADLLGTARALAGAIEQESADLILFGQQSADGGGACLWSAVAERLRRPVISQVSELTNDGGSVTGKRQTEFGYDTIRAPLPAVIAVSDAINTPRYPSLKGIMGAKKKPQDDAVGRRRRRRGRRRHDRHRAWRRRPRAARRARSRTTAAQPSRSSSSSRRRGSSDGRDARLPRASRRRDPEGLARRAREGGAAGRRRGRRADRFRRARDRRVGRPVRRRHRLRRGRRAPECAAAAAARRRAREARSRRRVRHGCSSRSRCSPPTWPPGSPRASTPA